jgi:hypothetical protein
MPWEKTDAMLSEALWVRLGLYKTCNNQQETEASYQQICEWAILEADIPAPVKPSYDCSPSWQFAI